MKLKSLEQVMRSLHYCLSKVFIYFIFKTFRYLATLGEAFLLFAEKLRGRMHLEQPGFSLPVLHPFTLDRMDLDFSEQEGG